MIGDWQDEWDLKRRGSDRSVNRHDTCRGAAYLNIAMEPTVATGIMKMPIRVYRRTRGSFGNVGQEIRNRISRICCHEST